MGVIVTGMSRTYLEQIKEQMREVSKLAETDPANDSGYLMIPAEDINFLLALVACAERMYKVVEYAERAGVKGSHVIAERWRDLLINEA